MIGRLGDLIADSTLESIQSFEKSNWTRLCKAAIYSGLCEPDDIPGFFNNKVTSCVWSTIIVKTVN